MTRAMLCCAAESELDRSADLLTNNLLQTQLSNYTAICVRGQHSQKAGKGRGKDRVKQLCTYIYQTTPTYSTLPLPIPSLEVVVPVATS